MKKRSREASIIDLTPLIDVVFLLLIFFMVSTVFKKEELALILNLPSAETKETKSGKRKSLQIEINPDTGTNCNLITKTCETDPQPIKWLYGNSLEIPEYNMHGFKHRGE